MMRGAGVNVERQQRASSCPAHGAVTRKTGARGRTYPYALAALWCRDGPAVARCAERTSADAVLAVLVPTGACPGCGGSSSLVVDRITASPSVGEVVDAAGYLGVE